MCVYMYLSIFAIENFIYACFIKSNGIIAVLIEYKSGM